MMKLISSEEAVSYSRIPCAIYLFVTV